MSQSSDLKFQETNSHRDNHGTVSFALPIVETNVTFGGKVQQKESISQQVASRFLGMIKSGNLVSGDRMPTEQQMCLAFGIGRPALREALKALTIMGVLESRQGGRYTVTDLSSKRLLEPFNIMLSMAGYNEDEHFEARSVVDLELVRLCGDRANVEQRRRIVELAEDGHVFYSNPVAFRLLDIEFHQALNAGARSPMLSTLSGCLYDVGLDLRRAAVEMEGVIETSVEQHCLVAKAIKSGDIATAVEVYRVHLQHIRDTTTSVKIKTSI